MRPLVRLLLTVLALAFAAGASVQAMAATQMAMPIAMSDPADGPMSHRDACGGGDPAEGMACSAVCTLAAFDMVTPALALRPVIKRALHPLVSSAMTAASRPPDPYPPKFPS